MFTSLGINLLGVLITVVAQQFPPRDAAVGATAQEGRSSSRPLEKLPAGAVESPAASRPAKFVPPKDRCLLFIGQDQKHIDDYADTIGREFAGVMTYIAVREPMGLAEFERLVARYPQAVFQVGLIIVAEDCTAIDRGERDDNLKRIGRVLKNSRRPVYLRVGYEFDYPDNHFDPAGYVKVFRRIHDLLSAEKVGNVAYVWHSYGYGVTDDLSRWYPGDDYVDWFGVSFFGGNKPETKRKVDLAMTRVADFARRRNKPLMIAEATPRGIGVTHGEESWRRWFAPCFDFIERNDVRAFCYINWDWESIPMFRGQGWGDTRIQINEYVKSAWLLETKKPRYLVAGPSLDRLLGHHP
jgi:hypothetical protein